MTVNSFQEETTMTTKNINTRHILLLILLIAITIGIGIGISQARLLLSQTHLPSVSRDTLSAEHDSRSKQGVLNVRQKRAELVDVAVVGNLNSHAGRVQSLDLLDTLLAG
jgi:hypothetical protein